MTFTGVLTTASFNQPAPKALVAGAGQQVIAIPVDSGPFPAGAKILEVVVEPDGKGIRVLVELPK